MPGWGKQRADEVKAAFYEFLNHASVKSKERGWIILGHHLYDAQIRVIEGIFDGLSRGIHDVKILKSRQLGVSTIIRALMLFWSGMFELTGALVFHKTDALTEARAELLDMLERMPDSYRFPRKKSSNRFSLSLDNRSRIAMMAAGEKETKGSNSLGASFAISLAHRSELCSYGNRSGLEAMRHSMARTNPNRIFVDESTARGRNLWHEIWMEAKDNPECLCIFIGWWSHPGQRIERGTPAFEKYTRFPLSDDEKHKIKVVKERYGHEIEIEQLAWIRKEMDLDAGEDDPEKVDFSGDPLRVQEQPWFEDEAWQLTASAFFDPAKLNDQANRYATNKFSAYMFMAGFEFTDFQAIKAPNMRSVQLKVWEEPVEDSIYVIGTDPAYGINENNDRSCVQVVRAYSDGLDQVAEYAWPLIDAAQLAWVIAALEAWYAGERSEVYRIIEINGPGEATYRELRSLKQKIQHAYFGNTLAERGLTNIQRNVRDYFYQRTDSLNPGQSLMFKCLALDTPLPTPGGWTTMGEVKVGDRLMDDTGRETRIVEAHPVLFGHECYRVTFSDNTSIVADSDHLWPTLEGLKPTSDLIAHSDRIPLALSFDLPDVALSVHPYTLGVWLGNGDQHSGYFSHHADDIEEISNYLIKDGETLGPVDLDKRNKNARRCILGAIPRLRTLGVLQNKHIPAAYLRGSFEQRLALLHGLMDTDGTIGTQPGRQASFTTTNRPIAEGFAELLRTLNIKARFLTKYPKLEYRGEVVDCLPAYQFWMTTYPDTPVFRLKRKVALQAWDGTPDYRRSKSQMVKSVESVPSVPVRCIEVDSKSHLFLAGIGMLQTHNTHSQTKIAIMERLRDFTNNGVLRVRSHALLEEMADITREGDSIGADGSDHDDRVLALALCARQWEEGPRRRLMAAKRTREFEVAKRRMSTIDMTRAYNENQFGNFLAGRDARRRAELIAMQGRRWGRR